MIHLWVLALIHSGVLVSHDGWLEGPACSAVKLVFPNAVQMLLIRAIKQDRLP